MVGADLLEGSCTVHEVIRLQELEEGRLLEPVHINHQPHIQQFAKRVEEGLRKQPEVLRFLLEQRIQIA